MPADRDARAGGIALSISIICLWVLVMCHGYDIYKLKHRPCPCEQVQPAPVLPTPADPTVYTPGPATTSQYIHNSCKKANPLRPTPTPRFSCETMGPIYVPPVNSSSSKDNTSETKYILEKGISGKNFGFLIGGQSFFLRDLLYRELFGIKIGGRWFFSERDYFGGNFSCQI